MIPQGSRPTSSIIATTPLQDLPPQCVAQAVSILGEPEKLSEWLAQKATRIALWRQGVDEPDVLAATAEAKCLASGESRHSPHTRYATQLLAQIAWEVDLCDEEAAPIPTAEHASKPPQVPVEPMRRTSQPRRPPSGAKKRDLDKENIVLERWEKKLAYAYNLKAQHKKEVEIRAREKNSKIEAVRQMHAKLLKENEELQYHRWQGRTQNHNDKIARSRCAKREVCELMMNAAAARQAVLETNRRRLLQEQAERQAKRLEQESERQSNAEKKRQDVRQERCVGKPRMRVAREISRKQALRLERIRSMEREDLRQKLLYRSPTATPSPRNRSSRPSSARTSGTPGFVPMPPSRPTSARRPHRNIEADDQVQEIPDPSCIPLPRYVRRSHRANPDIHQIHQIYEPKQRSPRQRPGCRSAPAGIAIARGQAVRLGGQDAATLDALGLFPVSGFRSAQSDLESDASTAARGFSEIVLWAWEDEPLSEPHSREKTFMTALDCDQVAMPPSESLEKSEHEIGCLRPSKVDAETQQDYEGEFCTCVQPEAFEPPLSTMEQAYEGEFCTCVKPEAVDPPLSTMESLEHGGAEGIPEQHPSERVRLTSSEASSSCS